MKIIEKRKLLEILKLAYCRDVDRLTIDVLEVLQNSKGDNLEEEHECKQDSEEPKAVRVLRWTILVILVPRVNLITK